MASFKLKSIRMNLSYILTHLGEEREKYFNSVAPPIIQTSNFKFDTVEALNEAFAYERGKHLYTRGSNPTVVMCAKKIAALEGSEDALLVGSGAAAISNAIIANVKAGDHVVCVNNAYSWAYKLLTQLLGRFGVTTTFVDGRDVRNFEQAIQANTTLFFLESPTSLVMELQDLKALVVLAKQHNIVTVLDHSYGSPLNNHPIQWGIDIVIHTVTKYLGGHSDVVAGVICSTKAMIDKIFIKEMMTLGNILHPMDAWLVLRSLRTLPLRIERSSETTQKVVAYLDQHPKVKAVLYPFLPTHPQYELAKAQMPIPMPLFSVEFHTQDKAQLDAVANALKYFLIAVSWGGHESLVLPVVADYHGTPRSLMRIYIGLEEADILIADLGQALEAMEI